MKKIFSILGIIYFLLLFSGIAIAQTNRDSEIVNSLRTDNKIYVVVLVLLTILIGLFLTLFSLEKKIDLLEKNQN